MTLPPEIDGDFDDWNLNAGVLLDATTASTVRPTDVPPPAPADNSARIWAAWDNSVLYIAARVWDDVLVSDSSAVWHDDELEFGFDTALDGEFGPDDHQITVNADGRVTDLGSIYLDDTELPRAIQVLSDGYQVEMAIPLAILEPPGWGAGWTAGFNIGLHDDDDGGNWDHYLIWQGSSTNSQAGDFGRLVLEGGCHRADVQPNSDHSNTETCDGDVDIADVQRVAGCWLQPIGPACPAALDLNGSGAIDLADVVFSVDYWGWRQ